MSTYEAGGSSRVPYISKRVLTVHLMTAAMLLIVACATVDPLTPTPDPTPAPPTTPTPTNEGQAKADVTALFVMQVDFITRGDWVAVYATCSPQFRAARPEERFVRDAVAQFERDGYSTGGFEARNVVPSVRASGRVRVSWDAYQDGQFVRTEEVGQVYIFTHGAWFDEGAWCR